MYQRFHGPEYIDVYRSELDSIIQEADCLLTDEGYRTTDGPRIPTYQRDNLEILASQRRSIGYDGGAEDRAAWDARTCRTATHIGRLGLSLSVGRTDLLHSPTGARATGYRIVETAAGVEQSTYIASADDELYAAGVWVTPTFTDEQGWTVVRAGECMSFFGVQQIIVAATLDEAGWRRKHMRDISSGGPVATRQAEAVIVRQAEMMRYSPIPLEFGSKAPSLNQLTHTWCNLSEAVAMEAAA